MSRPHFLLLLFPCLLILFFSLSPSGQAANPVSFCKCMCSTNVTIFPLDGPGGESGVDQENACGMCTRAFCLAKMGTSCGGPEESSGDLLVECFQRDSWKDEIIVKSYILIILGLIVAIYAGPSIQAWRARRDPTYGRMMPR
ncbi:hypothetical protein BJ684DRAFT_15742 [Piptocephalis cylindrospora]|uniref:Uncharacterized protein n=1 Tax=Piptocephalis cylindrospora TaxID=1907219 RepID=A0A4P9Y4Q8_9FUNG|nr:hypothetical protein BJ684DRAFT_15742 [Piptocephalis cylindrospora]|eukprot:RKP13905.1 hypothetical protein BJ684DRAFT_15742 [Piptocephalis cylindrospora]